MLPKPYKAVSPANDSSLDIKTKEAKSTLLKRKLITFEPTKLCIPYHNNILMKKAVFDVLFSLCAITSIAQTASNTYPGGARNWTALTWATASGGVAPTTNNATYTQTISVATIGNVDNLTINISFTLNGTLNIDANGSNPTITIPAGVTVIINGNLTNNDNNVNFVINGTLIVTGTVTAGNNAILGGTGTFAGGTLSLGGSGGSAPSCPSGCPAINFGTCTNATFCPSNNTTASNYVWTGSTSSDWTTSTNWTPSRTSPGTSDFLTFPGSGLNASITNIPTQTVSKILVTGASSYTFNPASAGNSLSTNATGGNSVQIDNGSTLAIGNGSNALNMNVPTNGFAEIGGQLNLVNGNFSVASATLTLHTNSTPLARTGGQVSTNASTILNFGNSTYTAGSTIVLPSSIFVADPTPVGSLTINRTNGATLGDQTILVSSTATFTLGVLTTNGAGRIRFGTSAANPVETASSYISGFSEMELRSVGTAAYDFLGLSLAAGADIGSVSLVRRTGTSGINTFNSNQSIASTWILSNTINNGRNMVFSWVSPLDNVTSATNQFQVYRYSAGPGWTPVGSLQNLTATTPRRQTASVTASTLNDTFTVTDQSQALPITLLSFSGSQWNETIRLKWQTASEKNFDYFSVEKSLDGKTFSQIAKVAGKGSDNAGANYLLDDEKPVIGNNYYRLQAVDVDGTAETFDIILVDYTTEKKFEVYPNPVTKNSIAAKINFSDFSSCAVVIYDQMSKVIHTSSLTSIETEFTFSSELVNGVYFAKLISPDYAKTVRFLVLR